MKYIGFGCVLVVLLSRGAYWIWQQQDLGKNLQVQRELARIYKMAVINQDQQTLQLIKGADQDRRLSQKEWQTIQASHSEILKNFDHSDAMVREKEFLQRKAAQQAL